MIPRDLLLKIAQCLELSIRDKASMKMTSRWWSTALSTTAPFPSPPRGPFAEEVHPRRYASPSLRCSPCQTEEALASRDCAEEVQLRQSTMCDKILRETDSSGDEAVAKGPRGRDAGGPRAAIAGNLPSDLIICIAQKLLKSGSRTEVAQMRSVCKVWSSSFEIAGPLLIVSRHPPSPELITVMKVVSRGNDPPAMEKVHSLHPPPGDSVCWGAVNGLIATQNISTGRLLLNCLTCGYRVAMPNLQDDLLPKGVFQRNDKVVLALINDNAIKDHLVLVDGIALGEEMTQLYVRQIDDGEADNGLLHEADTDSGTLDGEEDENDEKISLNWAWAQYPGAQNHYPMRSVNFFKDVSFAGVTQGSTLIVDAVTRGLDDEMATVKAPRYEGEIIVPWMKNGQHIFVCEERAYMCVLFRSIQDVDLVEALCFSIRANENGDYVLEQVADIGPYSVYLGSNQSIVLPTLEGCPGRLPNTLYIEDCDGIVRNNRILAINISTQEIYQIQFPDNFVFAPVDRVDPMVSAWVWSPRDQCHLD